MKLSCILTAVNENSLYSDFIPLFIHTWKKLYPNVDIKIIFIINEIPKHLEIYESFFIIFKPLSNISTSFIAQYIRLLYPALLEYDGGILISDIDNIPMNRTYFTKNIETFTNNKWISLRDWKYNNMTSMCWHVAHNSLWKEVFNIHSLNDIKLRIINKYKEINYLKNGWFTDQKDLYKYLEKWPKKKQDYIELKDKDTGYNRLCRLKINVNDKRLIHNIKNGIYSDYHCLRPMKTYQKINQDIFNLL